MNKRTNKWVSQRPCPGGAFAQNFLVGDGVHCYNGHAAVHGFCCFEKKWKKN